MSSDRRAPWWYSGDDEPEVAAGIDASAPDEVLDDSVQAEDESGEPPSAGVPAMDWTALIAGAAKMVDWATERVMAPHAEHVDPAAHPECMVCRTVTLIGDPAGLMGGSPDVDADADADADPEPRGVDTSTRAPAPAATTGAQPIRWIPIVESGD
jgi:hypothetical protein